MKMVSKMFRSVIVAFKDVPFESFKGRSGDFIKSRELPDPDAEAYIIVDKIYKKRGLVKTTVSVSGIEGPLYDRTVSIGYLQDLYKDGVINGVGSKV